MEKTKIIPFWTWFRATFFGLLLGSLLAKFIFEFAKESTAAAKEYSIVGFGIGISYMQYRVLRKNMTHPDKLWVWFSMFSVLIACWIVDLLRYISGLEVRSEFIIVVIVIKVLFSSLGLGVVQALRLKQMQYREWYIYIASNVVPLVLILTMNVFVGLQSGLAEIKVFVGVVSIFAFIISYPAFNALAFKYIQEKTLSDVDPTLE